MIQIKQYDQVRSSKAYTDTWNKRVIKIISMSKGHFKGRLVSDDHTRSWFNNFKNI